jgi:hypothetical protein
MSKLDEAIAVVFEERGGQVFALDEADLQNHITFHTSRGRKVWVFRKAEMCMPIASSGSESQLPSVAPYTGLP